MSIKGLKSYSFALSGGEPSQGPGLTAHHVVHLASHRLLFSGQRLMERGKSHQDVKF